MRLATLRTALLRSAVRRPAATRAAVFRAAGLCLQVALVGGVFGLGVCVGQREAEGSAAQSAQGSASNAAERQPVAGAVEAAAALPRSAEAAAEDGSAEDESAEARSQPAAASSSGRAKKSRAAPLPSWSSVAARAQSWTAAIRADQNYGAGVIVDPSGLVLTNLHVVEATQSITVTPFGGAPTPARVVDSDAELDLALLALPGPAGEVATLGTARALGVGDEVLAVGSPRKMYFSVSRGLVSFPNRSLDGVDYIQTDLPINVGNSGGPLVDRTGRVVGVVSFILKESQGLSFALPIDRAVSRFSKYIAEATHGAAAVAH